MVGRVAAKLEVDAEAFNNIVAVVDMEVMQSNIIQVHCTIDYRW